MATPLLASPPRTPPSGRISLEVVLPVHNEEAVLSQSVDRLVEYLRAHMPFSWLVTVADNASTDGTRAVAERLAVAYPGEVRVHHVERKGRGRALRETWLASEAAVQAYMDVDLSTGLDALLPLVAPLLSGHSDIAVGSRLAPGALVARGPKRETISRVYNAMLHVVFSNRFRDAQCGFKAIRRDVAQRLLPLVEDDTWFFDTELLLLAERNGLRIHEVPVDWIDDPDSRVHLRSTIAGDLKGMARMARTFARGGGRVELGGAGRAPLDDDLGRQLVSFAVVGVASTALSLALYLVLRSPLGPPAANVVAILATALGNTWAHRRWTFLHGGAAHPGRYYARASIVVLAGLALSTGAVFAAHRAGWGLPAELATLLATWAATTLARFVVLRRWAGQPSGRRPRRASPSDTA